MWQRIRSLIVKEFLMLWKDRKSRFVLLVPPIIQLVLFASAANFFCTFPILPYKMGLEPPNECEYALGYYRPGDCAPYMLDPFPLSVRGALLEAAAWVGRQRPAVHRARRRLQHRPPSAARPLATSFTKARAMPRRSIPPCS